MTPNPFDLEEMAGIMESAAQTHAVLNEEFRSLVPDLNSLQPILKGKPLEELAERWYVKPSGKSAFEIPRTKKEEGILYLGADLHGCRIDQDMLVKIWINDLVEGRDSYLGFLGDMGDPIVQIGKEGDPVTKPIDDKEGIDMYKRGLAVKDEEKKRFVFLPYPDNSIQVIANFLALTKLFGSRIFIVDGDHEKQLRASGFEVIKGGVDLTYHILGRLSLKEAEYLKNALNKQPAAVKTENGYLFLHAGPVPMLKSFDELENLVRDHKTPLRKEDDTDESYEKRKIDWINNTIEGRLNFGRLEKKGDDYQRIYSDEEIEKTLRAADAQLIISGHSGNARFIHQSETGEITHEGVNEKLALGRQVILGTTEAIGCTEPRSGKDRDGLNNYGVYAGINLAENFGTVYLGKLGSDLYPDLTFSAYKPKKQTAKPLDIIDRVDAEMKKLCDRKAFPQNAYETFKKYKRLIQQEVPEDDLLADWNYLKTNKSRNTADELSLEVHLDPLSQNMKNFLFKYTEA